MEEGGRIQPIYDFLFRRNQANTIKLVGSDATAPITTTHSTNPVAPFVPTFQQTFQQLAVLRRILGVL